MEKYSIGSYVLKSNISQTFVDDELNKSLIPLEQDIFRLIVEYYNNFNSLPTVGHEFYLNERENAFTVKSYSTYNDDNKLFVHLIDSYKSKEFK